MPLQPQQVFSVRGLEAVFPCARTLGCMVCLAPQLFLPVCLHANVGPPTLPAAALSHILSTWLPVSVPPTSLDECFFFNSLVVGLPYSLIFHQFWLFFVFKFVVLLLAVQGGIIPLYLCLHLGQKSFVLSSNGRVKARVARAGVARG